MTGRMLPIYVFRCPLDGEEIQRSLPMELRDGIAVTCPSCGSLMHRIPCWTGVVVWDGLWHDSAIRSKDTDGLGPQRGF